MYITGDEKRARKLVIELKKNHYTKLMWWINFKMKGLQSFLKNKMEKLIKLTR
jgi:hypothetical protein